MSRLIALWRLIKSLGPVFYLMADAFAYGARLYGDGTWRKLEPKDHLEIALDNILQWKQGTSSTQPVLIDALLRLAFATYLAIHRSQQPAEYKK